MAFIATPVWNSTSPISTKKGMGVSEKLVTEATPLRTTCISPGSPPRKSSAPTRLTPRKAKATGRPRPSSTVSAPNTRACHRSTHQVSADHPRPARSCRAASSASQAEAQRRRHVDPPFGEGEGLHHHRAGLAQVGDDRHRIPGQHRADGQAQQRGGAVQAAPGRRRQAHLQQVQPHVLLAPQQPGRGQQRGQRQAVFAGLGNAAGAGQAQVARQHVVADQHGHQADDQRCGDAAGLHQPAPGADLHRPTSAPSARAASGPWSGWP